MTLLSTSGFGGDQDPNQLSLNYQGQMNSDFNQVPETQSAMNSVSDPNFDQQITGDKMLNQNGLNVDATSIVADAASVVKTDSRSNINTSIGGDASKAHMKEWEIGSGVDRYIAGLNVQPVNSGKARQLLGWEAAKGEDALTGGWWCGSVNPITGEDTDFGQFKPDKPYKFKNRKPAKYLSPKGGRTEAIYLRMLDDEYWQKVLADVSIPVVVTEGAKKAGAMLTLDYPTIALVGVWNGQQAKGRELIDSLKAFAQPGREFILAFDADLITKVQVRSALEQLGKLLIERGCPCKVATWEMKDGKGIDDLLVNKGAEAVRRVVEISMTYDDWLNSAPEGFSSPQNLHAKVWSYVETALAPRLELDEFSLDYRLNGKPLVMSHLQAKIGEIVDNQVPKNYLLDVVHNFALQNPYSDVREYLKHCHERHPDAKGYIRQLVEMMGLEKDIEKLVTFKWLVAAVARAMNPGCEFHSVLIQKGVEGLGKTRLMRILAGRERFYETNADPSNKDFRQLTVGNWIIELGEIESTFRKSDISALKSYITQTDDKFRVPYGAKMETFPRHFLFCGSTNTDCVITDPDGVRRWWVVEVTKQFDLAWVERNRDKIWAEAFHYFQLGHPIYLSESEKLVYKEAAIPHRQTKNFYEGLIPKLDELKKEPFNITDLLSHSFQILPGSKNYRTAQMDIAHDLKLLGFDKKQCMIDGAKGRFWYYEPTSGVSATDSLELPFW